MPNVINILKDGDTRYLAVYFNGYQILHTRGGSNEEEVLTAVLAAIDASVDKTGNIVNMTHYANEFDFEKIWTDDGFIDCWDDVEKARLPY